MLLLTVADDDDDDDDDDIRLVFHWMYFIEKGRHCCCHCLRC